MQIYEKKIGNIFCCECKKMTKQEDHYLLDFMLESIYVEEEINYHNNAEKPQCVGQRCSGITVRRSIRQYQNVLK